MRQFSIERYKGVSDGMGGMTQDWYHQGYVYGYIDMLTGHDATAQNAYTQESTHVLVTDKANYDVVKADRIVANNINHEITYVDNPVGMDHHLEIYLKQVT